MGYDAAPFRRVRVWPLVVTEAEGVAKLPTISTGNFERLRRGRGLGLALLVAACLAVGLALYLWLGR